MPAGVSAFTALANVTLSGAASSVTFSSISQSYKDLFLVVSYKHNTSNAQAGIRLNGDSGSNYSNVGMAGWVSTASYWSNTATAMFCMNYSAPDSAQVVPLIANIMGYSETNKQKMTLLRSNHTNEVDAVANLWANQAAVTSVVIFPDAGQFAAGSQFELFGVSA